MKKVSIVLISLLISIPSLAKKVSFEQFSGKVKSFAGLSLSHYTLDYKLFCSIQGIAGNPKIKEKLKQSSQIGSDGSFKFGKTSFKCRGGVLSSAHIFETLELRHIKTNEVTKLNITSLGKMIYKNLNNKTLLIFSLSPFQLKLENAKASSSNIELRLSLNSNDRPLNNCSWNERAKAVNSVDGANESNEFTFQKAQLVCAAKDLNNFKNLSLGFKLKVRGSSSSNERINTELQALRNSESSKSLEIEFNYQEEILKAVDDVLNLDQGEIIVPLESKIVFPKLS